LAVLVLLRGEEKLIALLPYLLSLAVGGLLGAAFFHLMPESIDLLGGGLRFSGALFGGFFGFLLLERFLRLHQHPHHAEDARRRAAPYGILNLAGDAVHNFIDGAIIAAAFVTEPRLGLATTIAVGLHEIPQEIGDFAVLVHAGVTPRRAIRLNLVVAGTALLGAAVTLVAGARMEAAVQALLPVSAGSFLYIAASDLIPELQRESRTSRSLVQISLLLCGVLLMVWLA
jgi:zinc and cadmium transporter